jgi:DNA polymerase-3 subunit alpha
LDGNAEESPKGKLPKLYLKIEAAFQTAEKLNELKAILKKHPGTYPVILHYAGKDKTILLSEEYRVNGSGDCLEKLRRFLGPDDVVLKK